MLSLVSFAALVVQAQDIMVSWTSNGVLQATGMEPGTSYTVEWASDLQSGFVTNDAPFSGLIADSSGMGIVKIPLFFRVSGTPEAPPLGMVAIPEGTNSGTDPDYGTYSLTVTNTFYMDMMEVTKAQWDTVYNWAVTNGYSFDNVGLGKALNHPVQTVSWYDCIKWCNARSEMDDRVPCYTRSSSIYKTGNNWPVCDFNASGYRLPTSDEWEYAARGGLSGKRFPWGDTITHNQANYNSSSLYSYDISSTRGYHPEYYDAVYPYTSPAGSFSANGYGLYDMVGNVHDWCWDLQDGRRSFRGGSEIDRANFAHFAYEGWSRPDFAVSYRGFRAVCR